MGHLRFGFLTDPGCSGRKFTADAISAPGSRDKDYEAADDGIRRCLPGKRRERQAETEDAGAEGEGVRAGAVAHPGVGGDSGALAAGGRGEGVLYDQFDGNAQRRQFQFSTSDKESATAVWK